MTIKHVGLKNQTFFQRCNNLFPKILQNSGKELHDSHSTLFQVHATTKKLKTVLSILQSKKCE
jgi:hypothetical protein